MISFVPDFLLYDFLLLVVVVVRTHVKHNVVENFVQVFDLVVSSISIEILCLLNLVGTLMG